MLLALIAASFMRTTRTEINLTRNLIESAKAEALARRKKRKGVFGEGAGYRFVRKQDGREPGLPSDIRSPGRLPERWAVPA